MEHHDVTYYGVLEHVSAETLQRILSENIRIVTQTINAIQVDSFKDSLYVWHKYSPKSRGYESYILTVIDGRVNLGMCGEVGISHEALERFDREFSELLRGLGIS